MRWPTCASGLKGIELSSRTVLSPSGRVAAVASAVAVVARAHAGRVVPTHYIAMGLHEDLDEASRLAVRELVEFLVTEKKLSREDAYMLCSLAASLRVTQAVDATKGIHAMLAKSIFTAQ